MDKGNKTFLKVYPFALFLFIFIYVLIRSILNEPLHDEVATFFNYIETGKIYEKGVIQDAQNHLLNSYLSHYLYTFCGNNLFFLRLTNVLSFGIFFFGVYKLSRLIDKKIYQNIILTSLSTIPYIVEYFAYTRGYGLGLSFFVWVIIYSIKWVNNPIVKNAFHLYFFAYFSIFSNLIYFGSGCLTIALIGLIHLINIRKFTLLENIKLAALHTCFLLTIFPFFWLGIILRNGKALYYGSLKGLWEVTGKSLSKVVFFTESNLIEWMVILVIILCLITLLKHSYKNSFTYQFKKKESIVFYFLVGNLAIIFILAKLFNVNYPEDRVGMYFIPLFILLFGYMITEFNRFRPFIFVLLFFPLSFIYKMNLHTSIFSPGDRMTNKFYTAVRSHSSPNTSIAVYPLMATTWSFHERKQLGPKLNVNSERAINTKYDIILTRTNLLNSKIDLSLYHKIAYDSSNLSIAYRRNKIIEKRTLIEKKSDFLKSSKERIPLLEIKNLNQYINKQLILKVVGQLTINQPYDIVRIEIETTHENNSKTILSTLNQRWIQGLNKLNFPIALTSLLNELKQGDKKIIVYIWNPQKRIITFKNGNTCLKEQRTEIQKII